MADSKYSWSLTTNTTKVNNFGKEDSLQEPSVGLHFHGHTVE